MVVNVEPHSVHFQNITVSVFRGREFPADAPTSGFVLFVMLLKLVFVFEPVVAVWAYV